MAARPRHAPRQAGHGTARPDGTATQPRLHGTPTPQVARPHGRPRHGTPNIPMSTMDTGISCYPQPRGQGTTRKHKKDNLHIPTHSVYKPHMLILPDISDTPPTQPLIQQYPPLPHKSRQINTYQAKGICPDSSPMATHSRLPGAEPLHSKVVSFFNALNQSWSARRARI